jgi:hypothetical protein
MDEDTASKAAAPHGAASSILAVSAHIWSAPSKGTNRAGSPGQSQGWGFDSSALRLESQADRPTAPALNAGEAKALESSNLSLSATSTR